MSTPHAPQQSLIEATFITPWLSEEAAGENTRHILFRELVFQVLRSSYPWLLPILERSGAQILAGQGCVYVAMPSAPQDWIPIPELASCLVLVPWVEVGDVAQ